MDLTDEQWEVLEPFVPDPPQREDGRGRPWRHPRDVLKGILWVLRTAALPGRIDDRRHHKSSERQDQYFSLHVFTSFLQFACFLAESVSTSSVLRSGRSMKVVGTTHRLVGIYLGKELRLPYRADVISKRYPPKLRRPRGHESRPGVWVSDCCVQPSQSRASASVP